MEEHQETQQDELPKWIFQTAKEILLKEGELRIPMMHLEYIDAAGEPCIDMMALVGFSGEKFLLFQAGMQFAQGHPDLQMDHLRRITLVNEAWTSHIPNKEIGKKKHVRPVDDPNRGEALIAMIVEVQPSPGGKPSLKRRGMTAEILRHGGVLELAPSMEVEGAQMLTMIGPEAFLAGFGAAHMSEAEIAQVMRESGFGGRGRRR